VYAVHQVAAGYRQPLVTHYRSRQSFSVVTRLNWMLLLWVEQCRHQSADVAAVLLCTHLAVIYLTLWISYTMLSLCTYMWSIALCCCSA